MLRSGTVKSVVRSVPPHLLDTLTWTESGSLPMTYLSLSALHRDLTAVSTLLSETSHSPDQPAPGGASRTPLHYAVLGGDLEVLKALLDGGADVHGNLPPSASQLSKPPYLVTPAALARGVRDDTLPPTSPDVPHLDPALSRCTRKQAAEVVKFLVGRGAAAEEGGQGGDKSKEEGVAKKKKRRGKKKKGQGQGDEGEDQGDDDKDEDDADDGSGPGPAPSGRVAAASPPSSSPAPSPASLLAPLIAMGFTPEQCSAAVSACGKGGVSPSADDLVAWILENGDEFATVERRGSGGSKREQQQQQQQQQQASAVIAAPYVVGVLIGVPATGPVASGAFVSAQALGYGGSALSALQSFCMAGPGIGAVMGGGGIGVAFLGRRAAAAEHVRNGEERSDKLRNLFSEQTRAAQRFITFARMPS